MRAINTLLCFALLLFVFPSNIQADSKIVELERLARKDPVIKFNTELYKRLVADAGRNYSVIMLFTANDPRYGCSACKDLAEEMEWFGESWSKYHGYDYNSQQFKDHPVFLGQIEPDHGMDIFQSYSLTTIPHLAHVGPGVKKVTGLKDTAFLRMQPIKASDIANFVNSKVGVQIPLYVSPISRIIPMALAVITIALVVRFVRVFLHRFYEPMLWFVVAIGVYYICMAGISYNLIRKPPTADYSGGRVNYISPSPRSQYVGEGFIIATLFTAIGMLLVALTEAVPMGKTVMQKKGIFYGCCAVLFLCLMTVNNIYRQKYHSPAFHANFRFF
eukprot:TRINITY_DN753_c0_g1_i1.p1 TRINITY_DN753_c0_g1~~TRINITY_DN753_c0_g1_i1.p1  ORF type:complete len:331 (+),score=54.81 TRINITY_DN753_c0_g1_i1:62-1054(+)